MYWTLARYILNWFRKKDKQPLAGPFSEFFDVLVEKHQISINGEDSKQLGREFIDKKDAAEYVEKVLQPRFTNLKAEFQASVDQNKNKITSKIAAINNAIKFINEKLDEKNECNELFVLEKEKLKIKANVDEIEKVCFPEKQLKLYVDKTMEQFTANVDGIVSVGDNDEKTRVFAEKQKQVTAYVNRESANFRRLKDSFRPKILSTHYPPRKLFIWFFYLLCLILMISEVGISMRIIRDISHTNLKGAALTRITIIYSIGISVALAVIYKTLIDWFLFKGWAKGILFAVIYFLIFSFMTIFFSSEFGKSIRTAFTAEKLLGEGGLVLGFLSTCFALANGFLFREATYLYDLYHKMYPHQSINQILRNKKRLRRKFNKQLDKKNKESQLAGEVLESFGSSYTDEIYNYIARLENINITSFWLGFDSALAELVLNNHDIALAIFKNIKGKLFCEKK